MATIQNAANAYAAAEKHLRQAQKELLKIPATYKEVYEDGNIGYLESIERTASIKSIAGSIAAVELEVIWQHQSDTERADELGIDVGPASGGDDIGIMSGGPR